MLSDISDMGLFGLDSNHGPARVGRGGVDKASSSDALGSEFPLIPFR